MGAATVIAVGQQAILAKMRANRPTLLEYLRSRAAGNARSSDEWRKYGSIENAEFRNGMSQAYRDVEWMLERDRFAPDTNEWFCVICHQQINAGDPWMPVTGPGRQHTICPTP